MSHFDTVFDAHTRHHLDTWLDRQVDDDNAKMVVKAAMLATAADDPDFWADQGWPKLFSQANGHELVMEHRT